MADLAKLVVRLEAETAKYQAELESARNKLKKFDDSANSSLVSLSKNAALAVAAVATAVAAAAKTQIDYADSFNDLSERTGVAIETLSGWKLAADLADTSIESLGSSLGKLSKNMLTAATGAGAQADAFKSLGVEVLDAEGKLRASDDVLLDLADRFSKMEDGANKAALAQEFFGKSGTELIPFLNMGRDGLDEMRQKAQELGLVISTETAQAAGAFNDKLDEMKGAVQGAVLQIVDRIMPALEALTEDTAEAASGVDLMTVAVGVAVVAFKAGATAFIAIRTQVVNFVIAIETAAKAVKAVVGGDMAGAWAAMEDGYKRVSNNTEANAAAAAEVWRGTGKKVEVAAKEVDRKLSDTLVFGGKKPKESKAAADTVKPLLDALKDQAATLGYNAQQLELYRLQMAGATDAQIKYAESLQATIREYDNTMAVIDKALEAEQALHDSYERNKELILGESAAALDTYAKKLDELTQLYDRGRITLDQYKDASERAAEAIMGAGDKATTTSTKLDEFGVSAASALQGAFEDFFLDTSNGFDGLLQSFGQMVQQMIAKAAAAQLMEGLFGGMFGGSGSGSGILGQAANAAMSYFGGFFADGGFAPAGKMSVVGENGPELIVPSSTTRVLSNGQSRDILGDRGGVSQTFNISTPDANSFRQSQRQIARRAKTSLQV